jgi:hypothetical protein
MPRPGTGPGPGRVRGWVRPKLLTRSPNGGPTVRARAGPTEGGGVRCGLVGPLVDPLGRDPLLPRPRRHPRVLRQLPTRAPRAPRQRRRRARHGLRQRRRRARARVRTHGPRQLHRRDADARFAACARAHTHTARGVRLRPPQPPARSACGVCRRTWQVVWQVTRQDTRQVRGQSRAGHVAGVKGRTPLVDARAEGAGRGQA